MGEDEGISTFLLNYVQSPQTGEKVVNFVNLSNFD